MEDEPVSKKLKSEDSLIPEEEFLRRNKVRVWAGGLWGSAGAPAPLGCWAASARRGCDEASSRAEGSWAQKCFARESETAPSSCRS